MPQMPASVAHVRKKEQRGCQVVSLNFPSIPGGGGMREGMPDACSPLLARGPPGKAVGLSSRLPSARRVRRPLRAASSGRVTGAGLAVWPLLLQCITAPRAPALDGFCMESPDGGISFFTQWVLINILGNAITGSQAVETSGFPTLGQYGHRPWLSSFISCQGHLAFHIVCMRLGMFSE